VFDLAGNAAEWVSDPVDVDVERTMASGHDTPLAYRETAQINPHPKAAGDACERNDECAGRSCVVPKIVTGTQLPTPQTSHADPQKHCDGLTLRMIRGGSYLQGADSLRAASRVVAFETHRSINVGFRCASDI
jgi:formylglycine-generating enzyme required for sulfatase activity